MLAYHTRIAASTESTESTWVQADHPGVDVQHIDVDGPGGPRKTSSA